MLTRIRAGERQPGWEHMTIDEVFPAYLLAHLEDFEDLIL
jgi:hypothetical protein